MVRHERSAPPKRRSAKHHAPEGDATSVFCDILLHTPTEAGAMASDVRPPEGGRVRERRARPDGIERPAVRLLPKEASHPWLPRDSAGAMSPEGGAAPFGAPRRRSTPHHRGGTAHGPGSSENVSTARGRYRRDEATRRPRGSGACLDTICRVHVTEHPKVSVVDRRASRHGPPPKRWLERSPANRRHTIVSTGSPGRDLHMHRRSDTAEATMGRGALLDGPHVACDQCLTVPSP